MLYLSDAIRGKYVQDEFNVIEAPCGCGKTEYAVNTLPYEILGSKPQFNKVLYLIDTCAGRHSIVAKHPEKARCYDNIIDNGGRRFDGFDANRIVVITYVVVHSANKSAQVQARGRIRNDIENLYVLTPDTRYIDLTDRRINDFFNKPLDVEQKAALVQVVGLKDSQSHKVGWPTLKKALCENGCTILTHRMGTKNYDVIVPPDSVED